MDIEVHKLSLSGTEPRSYDPAQFTLSQTVMKAHDQWANRGLCGIVYSAVLLRNVKQDPTEDMRIGQWFEYQCTGALPSYGDELPTPEVYKRDSNANEEPFRKGDLKANWVHAREQSEVFHQTMKNFGWTIVEKGVRAARDGAGGSLDIIIQVHKDRWEEFVCEYVFQDGFNLSRRTAQGQPSWEQCVWRHTLTGEVIPGCIIIDLKYTGMLHEQWGPMSWNLERLPDDQSKMVQALHYHWLSGGLPFFFWVFSAKEPDNRLIRVFFEQSAIPNHVQSVKKIRDVIDRAYSLSAKTGEPAFTPRPDMRQCCQCPLRGGCKHKATTSSIFGIFAQ